MKNTKTSLPLVTSKVVDIDLPFGEKLWNILQMDTELITTEVYIVELWVLLRIHTAIFELTKEPLWQSRILVYE